MKTMKLTFVALALGLGLSTTASGSYSITALSLSVEVNFTEYDGLAAPANWTLTTAPFRGTSTGSNTSGGYVSFGTDGDGVDNDRWLGVQFAGTPSSVTMSTTFTNKTGSTITSLDIAYDIYQFRADNAGRSSFFNVSVAGNPIASLGFTADNTLATGERGTILGDTALATRLAATVGGLSIANDETITVSWIGARGNDTTGNAQGIGINNISVQAIPEPSTYALLFGAGVLGLALIRRKFSR
jgi:hypothetical protein